MIEYLAGIDVKIKKAVVITSLMKTKSMFRADG